MAERAWQPDPSRPESTIRFAAGMAHDFGNLLTIIRGFSELLQAQYREQPELQEGFGEILTAVTRATAMTDMLAVIGRRQRLDRQPTDLRHALAQLAPAIQTRLGTAIRLELVTGPDAMPMRLDVAGLKTAPGGYLSDLAVLAMPSGGTWRVMCSARNADAAFGAAHPWSRASRYAVLSRKCSESSFSRDDVTHAMNRSIRRPAGGRASALGWRLRPAGRRCMRAPSSSRRRHPRPAAYCSPSTNAPFIHTSPDLALGPLRVIQNQGGPDAQTIGPTQTSSPTDAESPAAPCPQTEGVTDSSAALSTALGNSRCGPIDSAAVKRADRHWVVARASVKTDFSFGWPCS